jgi:ribonuclease P protein component
LRSICGKRIRAHLVYTFARPPARRLFSDRKRLSRETHLPAQRPPAQAQARLPRPDGHSCRAGDPQAPQGEGPQAALCLTRPRRAISKETTQRRNRLSRSRDFDAVYRQGRSTTTRYLVLYWFPRSEDDEPGEPRLGLAVPKSVGNAVVRNRVKRQLRETWRELVPLARPGHDYVLVARPGLAEPADTRGHAWLVERVTEVLEKATA